MAVPVIVPVIVIVFRRRRMHMLVRVFVPMRWRGCMRVFMPMRVFVPVRWRGCVCVFVRMRCLVSVRVLGTRGSAYVPMTVAVPVRVVVADPQSRLLPREPHSSADVIVVVPADHSRRPGRRTKEQVKHGTVGTSAGGGCYFRFAEAAADDGGGGIQGGDDSGERLHSFGLLDPIHFVEHDYVSALHLPSRAVNMFMKSVGRQANRS
jgi:hypothetical protein